MVTEFPVDSKFEPGEGCIPLTPQAKRLGWSFPVQVTHTVWSEAITWDRGKKTNPDQRIFELLESAWNGLQKALATDDSLMTYDFKHWFWERGRKRAKKQACRLFSARLLMDANEKPWMLIYEKHTDTKQVLQPAGDEQNS
jgi:hypothetical protein